MPSSKVPATTLVVSNGPAPAVSKGSSGSNLALVATYGSQVNGDDGASKIGAQEYTSTGSFGVTPAGSVRSQLDAIFDEAGHLTNTNSWDGAQTFNAGLTLDTANPFPVSVPTGDLTVTVDQGDFAIALAGPATENFTITDGTDAVLNYAKNVSGTVEVDIGRGALGVLNAYDSDPNTIRGTAPTVNEARNLRVAAATAPGFEGASLLLRVGGSGTVGTLPGGIVMEFDVNGSAGGQRRVIPTTQYALPDSGAAQVLRAATGGTSTKTTTVADGSVVIIEAYVFSIDYNGGTIPTGSPVYSALRRTTGYRNSTSSHLIVGPTTDATQEVYTHDGLSAAVDPSCRIVAGADGFNIEYTPAALIHPADIDQLVWGYLVISTMAFGAPDFDLI